jgi:DNA-binding beta-propeller fold protein YncE
MVTKILMRRGQGDAQPTNHPGRWIFLLMLAFLAGCSAAPAKPEAQAAVFYPPLPNPPRIQHLASFSRPGDLHATDSAFLDFIVGKESQQNDDVKKPYGVAIFEGKIYVVDTRGPGYAVFDLVKQHFDFVSGSGNGHMLKPINISIDVDGTKYVTDTGRGQVLTFDRNDRFVRAYGLEKQFKPGDVAVVLERLYVTDLEHHQIVVLDKASGAELLRFGKAGSKDGELFFPTNITFASDNHLYVTDTGNFRIQKFTLDGQFVRSYGTLGSGFGQFARPKGVALDRDGQMYVVDAAFENVQVLNNDGKLLLFFSGPGEGPADINLPTAIVVDYANVALFQKYADPKFRIEYLVLVASQFGANKVNVFGYGKMQDMDYPAADVPAEKAIP